MDYNYKTSDNFYKSFGYPPEDGSFDSQVMDICSHVSMPDVHGRAKYWLPLTATVYRHVDRLQWNDMGILGAVHMRDSMHRYRNSLFDVDFKKAPSTTVQRAREIRQAKKRAKEFMNKDLIEMWHTDPKPKPKSKFKLNSKYRPHHNISHRNDPREPLLVVKEEEEQTQDRAGYEIPSRQNAYKPPVQQNKSKHTVKDKDKLLFLLQSRSELIHRREEDLEKSPMLGEDILESLRKLMRSNAQFSLQ